MYLIRRLSFGSDNFIVSDKERIQFIENDLVSLLIKLTVIYIVYD